jgi:glycosyltransferase involved in cell wall biosynthesis
VKGSIVLSTEWNSKFGGAENVNIAILDIFRERPQLRAIWSVNSNLEPCRESVIRFFSFLPKSVQGIMSLPYHLAGVPKDSKLLISSSFMFSHLSKIRGGGKHLIYVHTPIRYIWNPEIDNRAGNHPILFRFVSRFVKYLEIKFLDRQAVYIANSAEVKSRIMQHWRVESEVVHPPVDVTFFSKYFKSKNPEIIQLISAGRFVKYKNHEQAINLSRLTGIPLILAGSGPEEKFLREYAYTSGAEVYFEIKPSRERLAELISNSSVYLHLAHEDFGILPIEAMATGTPVLGYAFGGLLETVDSQNGCLVKEFSQLENGIEICLTKDRLEVASSVKGYSEDYFKRNMVMTILKHWPELTPDINGAYVN